MNFFQKIKVKQQFSDFKRDSQADLQEIGNLVKAPRQTLKDFFCTMTTLKENDLKTYQEIQRFLWRILLAGLCGFCFSFYLILSAHFKAAFLVNIVVLGLIFILSGAFFKRITR